VRRDGTGGYWASDDKHLIDVARVHGWLSREAYWAKGRSIAVVASSIEHSLVVGLYAPDGAQVGFARVVTDRSTFGWLCDVFVDPAHRGLGLGSFLVEATLALSELSGVRLVLSATPGRSLYARLGFVPLASPERWMERVPQEPSSPASQQGRPARGGWQPSSARLPGAMPER
jgi:GNAT superfamily N-acetyltransferase